MPKSLNLINRRQTIRGLALAAGALSFARPALAEVAAAPLFTLPPIGYPYEALEPYIDKATMNVHHTGHHQAAVDNLNKLVPIVPELKTKTFDDILASLDSVPEQHRAALRNALGGHYNHVFFWDLMTPGGPKEPTGDFAAAISGAFGSKEGLIEAVNKAGLARFGSGWTWLVVDRNKKLAVMSTANQDPVHAAGARPVIGIDVWEHAYYLKHQNRRAEYLKDWWNVINWDKAAANFKKFTG
jgi:Fe-Mn family superoxide dismutase